MLPKKFSLSVQNHAALRLVSDKRVLPPLFLLTARQLRFEFERTAMM